MNTLIWFSIPGAVAVYSLYMSIPQFKALPSSLVIASAPVIGFLIHQLYRTVFEWIGGWENIKRPVLRLISEEYKGNGVKSMFGNGVKSMFDPWW